MLVWRPFLIFRSEFNTKKQPTLLHKSLEEKKFSFDKSHPVDIPLIVHCCIEKLRGIEVRTGIVSLDLEGFCGCGVNTGITGQTILETSAPYAHKVTGNRLKLTNDCR